MWKQLLIISSLFLFIACNNQKENQTIAVETMEKPILNKNQAKLILELPVSCIEQEYPNKLGQVLGSAENLKTPKELRPIFYGCFDWHSSVHGYWSIVKILKDFPELDADKSIRNTLDAHITDINVAKELEFFKDKNNLNFERTYGWAWLFVLQDELLSWKEDAQAQKWAQALEPLVKELVIKYEIYLPKLNYPVRTGTHDNTAFGLSLSLDYARSVGNNSFEKVIIENAKRLYQTDKACPLTYEPSGHDFLSPCLEEALLMSKVYDKENFISWMHDFLPQVFDPNFELNPTQVSDRSDGHLVHLDGLNFSRATCLSGIAKKLDGDTHLENLAIKHLEHSLNNLSGDHYMGSHWLGSFALYALNSL